MIHPLTIHLQTFILKLVMLFILIFVLEETIYGRLSLGSFSYLFAKTWTEAFLYFFLLLVIVNQLVKDRLLQYQPTLFDLCILTFLSVAILSTIFNHGSLVLGVLNIRTMLRYISIYYIIVITGWLPTEQQFTKLINLIIFLAVFQSILVVFQHFAGDVFREQFFSSLQVEITTTDLGAVLNAMETKIGAGYGTFGKTALLAFYLLFSAVFVLTRIFTKNIKHNKKWWMVYFIIVLGIFFSYKRATLLLVLFAPVLVAWLLGHKRFVKWYMIVSLIIIPLMVAVLLTIKPTGHLNEKQVETSPIESLSRLFSEEYWKTATTKSRGWMIIEVGRQALVSFKPIGYGADEENAKAVLATKGGEFGKLVGWGAFDDVYIVAGLVYYGPLGIIALLVAFFYIYRCSKELTYTQIPHHRILGSSMAAILILMFLSVFLVRLLEFRAFAFIFWVFAGIVVLLSKKYTSYKCQLVTTLPYSVKCTQRQKEKI